MERDGRRDRVEGALLSTELANGRTAGVDDLDRPGRSAEMDGMDVEVAKQCDPL